MKKTAACLLTVAAFCAANPIVQTYLSEVGVDSARQFVELHYAPDTGGWIDLTGWQLATSTSVCTLEWELGPDEYLVVDSAGLNQGVIGHGRLQLNPLADSLILIDDTGGVSDWVVYPNLPTDHGSGPPPPPQGSISFWNYRDFDSQSMNWYVDSTPTPGLAGDDYSGIYGSVSGSGGIVFQYAGVGASGEYGSSGQGLYEQSSYCLGGLGAGSYCVRAYGYYQGHGYFYTYPEMVTVGYNHFAGINIVIPMTGVADRPAPANGLSILARGRTLVVRADERQAATVEVNDGLGRNCRLSADLSPGTNELSLRSLPAGVYFVTCRTEATNLSRKVVLY